MLAEPRRPGPNFRGEHTPARPSWAAARVRSMRPDETRDVVPLVGASRSFVPADDADGRLAGPH